MGVVRFLGIPMSKMHHRNEKLIKILNTLSKYWKNYTNLMTKIKHNLKLSVTLYTEFSDIHILFSTI